MKCQGIMKGYYILMSCWINIVIFIISNLDEYISTLYYMDDWEFNLFKRHLIKGVKGTTL